MYICEINKGDVLEISKIGKASLPISYSSYHLLQLMNDKTYTILKIVDKIDYLDIIVGFIILRQYSSIHIHIMSIAILSKFRRKQYGSYLLNYMKDIYPSMQYTLYVQTINVNAIMFYIKHGFKIYKYIADYYTNLENKSAYYCINSENVNSMNKTDK